MSARRGGWYYGWNIVAVCVLSQVASMGLTFNAFSLFLRDWAADLHTGISQLQFAMLTLTVVGAVFGPIAGALGDRLPPRRLFGAGLLGTACFYFGIGSATAAWQIVVLYGFAAIAVGVCTAITSNALIPRWFARRRGVALGISAFGIGLAGVILPPIIAAVLPDVGWRAIWHFGAALLAFIVAPLVVLVLRDHPTEREGLHYLTGSGSSLAVHGHRTSSGQLGWRDILKSRNYWLIISVFVPVLSTYGGVSYNLAPYAVARGLGEQSAGMLLSLLSTATIVATLALGFLSDRFGNRMLLAGLAVSVALGASLLAFAQDLSTVATGCVLIGFGGGLFTPLAAGLAREFGAEGTGLAFGMCMVFVPVATVSAVGIARTQEVTGSYAPALITLTFLVLAGGMLVLLLREKQADQLIPGLTPAH